MRGRLPPPSPPKFDENKLLAYNDISSLPEYKVYSHALVQRLEQFRVAYLKYSRIQAIIQHRAECGDRKMASLRQTLESSFVEEADIVFSTLNSAGVHSVVIILCMHCLSILLH